MLPFQIEITDQQSLHLVQHDHLREIATAILKDEQVGSARLSIALVDDSSIHRVNREFLGHDYPTDVISFPLDEEDEPIRCLDGELEDRNLEGELIVSVETAIRESGRHGWSTDDEITLYVVHGLLHLCGYDDLTDEARAVMRHRERQVLAQWHLIPTGLEA